MIANDVSVRPAQQKITIADSYTTYYGSVSNRTSENKITRTQATVLRAYTSTVIWPGEYIEVELPSLHHLDCTLFIEPHLKSVHRIQIWPPPQLIQSINGKIRILNDSPDPQRLINMTIYTKFVPLFLIPALRLQNMEVSPPRSTPKLSNLTQMTHYYQKQKHSFRIYCVNMMMYLHPVVLLEHLKLWLTWVLYNHPNVRVGYHSMPATCSLSYSKHLMIFRRKETSNGLKMSASLWSTYIH